MFNILLYFQIDFLLLKCKHLEKTKYITANDFFSINYAMLFNVNIIFITYKEKINDYPKEWFR